MKTSAFSPFSLFIAFAFFLAPYAHSMDVQQLLDPQTVSLDKTARCDGGFRDRLLNSLNADVCILTATQNCLFARNRIHREPIAHKMPPALRTPLLAMGATLLSREAATSFLERFAIKQEALEFLKFRAASLVAGAAIALIYAGIKKWQAVNQSACYADSRYSGEDIDFSGTIQNKCIASFSLDGPRFARFIDQLETDPAGVNAKLDSHPLTCAYMNQAYALLVEGLRSEMLIRDKIKMSASPVLEPSGDIGYHVRIGSERFKISILNGPSGIMATRFENETDGDPNGESFLIHHKQVAESVIPDWVEWKTRMNFHYQMSYNDLTRESLAIPHRGELMLALRYATLSNPVIQLCMSSVDSLSCLQSEFPELQSGFN